MSSIELRKRSERYEKAIRKGEHANLPSRREVAQKSKTPVPKWLVGVFLFVVVGGVFFELIRLFL
ncbi:hypothetical protein BT69DRAFT_269757 [Atractiella rhizophila]|nr:hypothetical protein BT69DRAFT_269757 [Atractiella rhizophila]